MKTRDNLLEKEQTRVLVSQGKCLDGEDLFEGD